MPPWAPRGGGVWGAPLQAPERQLECARPEISPPGGCMEAPIRSPWLPRNREPILFQAGQGGRGNPSAWSLGGWSVSSGAWAPGPDPGPGAWCLVPGNLQAGV